MRTLGAFAAGAVVGVLGGLIGLGGAEYRLPLLVLFGFGPLEAVILNKASSLIVVTAALPARAATIPWTVVGANWMTVANLLAGSLAGAWFGATWATRLRSEALYRVFATFLVGIAVVLVVAYGAPGGAGVPAGAIRFVLGVAAGFVIGVVASMLGVAGGELLIPTLVLLFGAEIKLAGSLSLLVSLPTMLTGFSRYSRDRSFGVLRENPGFLAAMGAGSIAGSWTGGRLVGIVPSSVLLPTLALIMLISAAKLWFHQRQEQPEVSDADPRD